VELFGFIESLSTWLFFSRTGSNHSTATDY
jgi:hypothetical protein